MTAYSKESVCIVWIHVGYCNRDTCSLQGYSQQRSVSGSELQIFFLEISSQLSQPMEDVIATLEEEEVDVIKLCTTIRPAKRKFPHPKLLLILMFQSSSGQKWWLKHSVELLAKSFFYNLELVTSQMAQWFSVFSSASTYAVLNSGIREDITAAICMSALLQHTWLHVVPSGCFQTSNT